MILSKYWFLILKVRNKIAVKKEIYVEEWKKEIYVEECLSPDLNQTSYQDSKKMLKVVQKPQAEILF